MFEDSGEKITQRSTREFAKVAHKKNDILLRAMDKQCGMVYKETENTLIDTGMQPFIVQVDILRKT